MGRAEGGEQGPTLQLWNECNVKKRSFAMIEEAIAETESKLNNVVTNLANCGCTCFVYINVHWRARARARSIRSGMRVRSLETTSELRA